MFDLSTQDFFGIILGGCAALLVVWLFCIGLGACVEWFERMEGDDE